MRLYMQLLFKWSSYVNVSSVLGFSLDTLILYLYNKAHTKLFFAKADRAQFTGPFNSSLLHL